jgi:hypothetical protein
LVRFRVHFLAVLPEEYLAQVAEYSVEGRWQVPVHLAELIEMYCTECQRRLKWF